MHATINKYCTNSTSTTCSTKTNASDVSLDPNELTYVTKKMTLKNQESLKIPYPTLIIFYFSVLNT